jgi:hypothetical protein
MHTRHRTVLLACALGALLAAVAVCAIAAAPARAATALPARGIWAIVTGSPTATERWVDVAQGPGGSLYAGGTVASGTASSTSDLMVAKFSANDKAAEHLLWSDTWDNPTEHLGDQVTAIAVDRSGALIAVGTTQSAGSGREWVVVKWSSGGAKLWQQTFAASAGKNWTAEATDVVCNPAGAIYVCGTAQTGTHGGRVVSSLVVRKLSGSDGHLLWMHGYSGAAHSANVGVRLALDSSGNVFCTGRGTGARGDNDIVTVRLAAGDGRQAWVRRIGAAHRNDQGVDIALRAGKLWVAGSEQGTTGSQVVALARYTLNGQRLWLRTWIELPKTLEHPHALAVDAHGNAVVVGAGNNVQVTRQHAFVLHYNAAGRLTWWRKAYGSVSGRAVWQDVVADSAGSIWTAGSAVTGSTRLLIVARYTPAGVNAWTTTPWTGPAGRGATGNALCFAGGGIFVGGTVTTQLAGLNALGVKLTK